MRAPEETLDIARRLAPNFGVTRVVETTWLDRIGIPVYASIRPAGAALCVHSGKGATATDAQVGAYMEAIEFEVAEQFQGKLLCHSRTVADLDRIYHEHGFAFQDLCPSKSVSLADDEPILCYGVPGVFSPETVPIPAELIYLWHHKNKFVFGTSTNGLASGNTREEALLHGLCELVERDSNAFNNVKDRSVLLRPEGLPEVAQDMIARLDAAGFHLIVRYTQTPSGLPHFTTYLMEAREDGPLGIAFGSAAYPLKSIALVRAISEAVQSRLVHIHGGRDDIVVRHEAALRFGDQAEIEFYGRLRRFHSRAGQQISYSEVTEPLAGCESVADYLSGVCDGLKATGFAHVLAVDLEAGTEEICVMRVIVPGLEYFEHDGHRIGTRLRAYAQEHSRLELLLQRK